MIRVLKWLSLAVVLVLLGGAGVAVWLLDTPAGLQFAIDQANARVAGLHVEVHRIQGAALQPLRLDGLAIHTGDLDLTAARVDLDWSPSALWHREIHLTAFQCQDLVVVTHPATTSSVAGPPLRVSGLPFSVVIDQAAVDRVRISPDGAEAAPFEVRDFALSGRWVGADLDVSSLAATLAATGPLRARARGRMLGDHIAIDSLSLSGPGQVDGRGTLGLGAVPSDLQLAFSALHWPLLGPPEARILDAAQGTAHLTGLPENYGYALDLSATVNRLATRVASHGRGSRDGLQLDALALDAAGGHLEGHGNLAWAPDLRADLDAVVEKLDPALFDPALKGEINGTVRARTTVAAAVPVVDFEAHLARSALNGYPLALDATGSAHGSTVRLASFSLVSGRSTLTGQGQVTPPFDVTAHFDSPDLGPLYAGLAGAGHFDLSLSGPLEGPHVVSRGTVGGLVLTRKATSYRVAKLDWDVDVDLDAKAKADSRAELDGTGIDAGLIVPRLQFTAKGREVYHSLSLTAQTERGDLSIGLQGGYDRRRQEWGGELHSGSIAPKPLAALTLEKPAGLLLGRRRYSLEPACFAGTAGRACADVVHNVFGATTRIQWHLDGLQLAALKALMPSEDRVEGRIDGQGDLALAGGDITAAHANLAVTGAKFTAQGVPPIEFLPSHVLLAQDEGRLHADVDIHFPQGSVTGDVAAAPAATLEARALSGRVALDVPDVAVLAPFLPEARAVGGTLGGSFDFAGTLGAPRFSGRLALADGRARLVTPGIDLTAVAITAASDGGPFTLSGAAHSGDGDLNIAGTLDLLALPPRADLTLKGQHFQVMNTVQGKVWVSPDLHLLRDDSGVHLTGTFAVPQAEITPQGLGKGGQAPSADQVIVGAPPPPQKTGIPVFCDVDLTLGDAVHIEGFGLKTRIEGSLHLHDEPLRDPTGRGELRLIDGSYQAYGQDLTLQNGRLIFDGGSVVEPAVDIYAVRRPADNITVGVKVRGTLDQPELSLSSDPVMPREQQLSWLVLGRSLDSSSTQDRSLITAAAMSLGLSGGDYFANKVGKKLGIDEISIGSAPAFSSDVAADTNFAASQGIQTANNTGTTTAAQSAQLTLGKYLTPKLFVSYGVSLFDSGYVFRLIYDLGHGFKLQGESGTDNGGDIVYTVERGK